MAVYTAYPAVMVAARTPQGQRILSNTDDFIMAVIPSTTPKPNWIGILGDRIGSLPSVKKFFNSK